MFGADDKALAGLEIDAAADQQFGVAIQGVLCKVRRVSLLVDVQFTSSSLPLLYPYTGHTLNVSRGEGILPVGFE